MNKNITKQQINNCIYLFRNAAMRNPEHTQTLVNVYSAHYKCARTYAGVAHAVAVNNEEFNNLVENLHQTIHEAILLDRGRL